jgi:trehalose 6-phosphate phosphatase
LNRERLPAPLRALAAEPDHAALFLDFDGTLAAIVEDPVAARPLPGVPGLLARLAARVALVAVVSGRPTAFLDEVLETPEGVVLVGLYGLERAVGTGPDGARWAGVIADVVTEASAAAPEGVYVEPKGLTVTLHWRHAPAERPWVVDFAERQRVGRDLRIHGGRMELELRPPLDVDKGTVVRALANEGPHPLHAAAVFGDDLGDLPAFEAVGEIGAASVVRVAAVDEGSPAAVAARADLTVEGAAGAVELLSVLAAVVEEPAAQR